MIKRTILLLVVTMLSACIAAPFDTQRAPLSEARHLIAQAKAAGAEQCAPQAQAIAVANLQEAAHELVEHGEMHWQRNNTSLQRAISAAKKALQQCTGAVSRPDRPTIYFAYRSFVLSPVEQNKLRKFLSTHPTEKLSIEGYADERGTKRFNQKLSQQRAQAVADFLHHHGIANQQMVKIIGLGKTHPVATEHNESAWHLNRRTEVRHLTTEEISVE